MVPPIPAHASVAAEAELSRNLVAGGLSEQAAGKVCAALQLCATRLAAEIESAERESAGVAAAAVSASRRLPAAAGELPIVELTCLGTEVLVGEPHLQKLWTLYR